MSSTNGNILFERHTSQVSMYVPCRQSSMRWKRESWIARPSVITLCHANCKKSFTWVSSYFTATTWYLFRFHFLHRSCCCGGGGKLQHAWAFCRHFKSLLSSYLPPFCKPASPIQMVSFTLQNKYTKVWLEKDIIRLRKDLSFAMAIWTILSVYIGTSGTN